MEEKNTNWQKSVCAVVLHEGKVLLARHTYGAGKGLFITPGGYLKNGESPEQAMCRELMEETGITAKPVKLLAVRFSEQDWYAAFLAEYTGGTPRSDGDENDRVVWMDCEEALSCPDVPDLSKKLITAALSGGGLTPIDYAPQREKFGAMTFYVAEK